MRKLLAAAIISYLAIAVQASEKHDSMKPSVASELLSSLSLEQRTKNFLDDPEFDVYNPDYKQRLDSLQKTVPLPYNKYVHHYIGVYIDRPAQIARMAALSSYYFPIYESVFNEAGIPEEIKFLSIVESALDPTAISRSGASGLWQFMFTTAKGYGLTIDNFVDERRDPVASSHAAASYFKDAFLQFGDWLLAIASYNCGRGAVARAIERAGGVKDFWAIRQFLPIETQNYVPAFIATTYIMNYYARHGIGSAQAQLPEQTEVIQVNRFVSLSSIAKAANLDLKQLSALNPSYKKNIINGTSANPKPLVLPLLEKEIYFNLYTALNSADAVPKMIQVSTNHKRPTAQALVHNVRSGENLSTIANRYHIEVQDIKVWNNLKSSVIVPGQRLKVSSGKGN